MWLWIGVVWDGEGEGGEMVGLRDGGMRGDGGCGGEREGRWGEWDGADSD